MKVEPRYNKDVVKANATEENIKRHKLQEDKEFKQHAQIFKSVSDIITDILEGNSSAVNTPITQASTFKELGFDDLDREELITLCGDEFDIDFSYDFSDNFTGSVRVCELCDYIIRESKP